MLEKNIFLSVLGLSILALVIALLIPGGKAPDVNPNLPWNVDIEPSGASKVLGLTLGKSTMEDARQTFSLDGEINIFVSPENTISMEAYFDRIATSGIKADVILYLSMEPEILNAMYKRGARIMEMGNGEKKVNLSSADMVTAANAIIQRITYLPTANLDAELISSRFGTPNSIIKEESGIEHWLYPDIGLDLALNPDGKEIFQYINPARFDELLKPLQEMTTPEK